MLHSGNLKQVLRRSLEPIKTPVSTYQIQSAVLLSAKTGSIVSFAGNDSNKTSNKENLNHLKMMALLIREKWAEDEQDPSAQATKSCYPTTIPTSSEKQDGAVQSYTSRIYTCGLEDLHTCVAQIPGSDLLLLFIGDSAFPHGLLVMKMKNTLGAFKDVYGYKLD
ncbi:HGR044Wp [Eremothecium sinecaudum]|uniref:HGR044Wp n=1 Tax=Eremothecium sinecaudum TaxID=45286 RepID=A0A109V0H8_9SACH|nr:HGR044Wp [Eremothecium sinecaudum]AMD22383.1 HGR044Wp [Eremothecium sinecaudum]